MVKVRPQLAKTLCCVDRQKIITDAFTFISPDTILFGQSEESSFVVGG